MQEAPDVTLVAAGTITDLVAKARAGDVEAVAVDPELGTGWPVDNAEWAVKALPSEVAVGIVCRSADDAEQIEHRVAAAANVRVLLANQCNVQQLVTVLTGLLTARSIRRSKL